MKRVRVNARGIRASVKPTVTVYTLKRGGLRFGEGQAIAVRCSFFRIVERRVKAFPVKIETRRVKVNGTYKAV